MIAENAGIEGSLVVARLREEKKGNIGFNAATMEYEDLMAAGIIDPAKVTRSRAAERGLDRGHAADHRGLRHRRAREGRAGGCPTWAAWAAWAAWAG